MKRKSCFWIITLSAFCLLFFPSIAKAQTPVVRTILFFSPTCVYCKEVINNDLPPTNGFLDKFFQDPTGNTLAVIILIGMIISFVFVGIGFVTGRKFGIFNLPMWLIPLLAVIGFGVAFYLSFLEITKMPGVCGPIGNCDSVQESPYSYLFGIIPVGILGAMGYLIILAAWLLKQFGPPNWRKILTFCIWVLALFGTLFSIYLTFLEPFVIGATCIWCLSSAIIMTIILLISTGPVIAYSTLSVSDEKSNDNCEEFEQFAS